VSGRTFFLVRAADMNNGFASCVCLPPAHRHAPQEHDAILDLRPNTALQRSRQLKLEPLGDLTEILNYTCTAPAPPRAANTAHPNCKHYHTPPCASSFRRGTCLRGLKTRRVMGANRHRRRQRGPPRRATGTVAVGEYASDSRAVEIPEWSPAGADNASTIGQVAGRTAQMRRSVHTAGG
jgi:hypothetical protein